MNRTHNIPRSGIIGFATLVLFSLVLILLMRPGGIGGTGISGSGGVGGTGVSTGFIGRIDGFGSIYVNGVEIFYDEKIPVIYNQRTGSTDELKIGQIVHVLAAPDAIGNLQASQLHVRFEVIGPVQTIGHNTARIFGQKIILPEDGPSLTLGEQVAVSGFVRTDGVIQASRIDQATGEQAGLPSPMQQPFFGQSSTVSLSGYVRAETDGYSIYGYRLNALPTGLVPDVLTIINAKPVAGALEVTRVIQKPVLAIPATVPPAPDPVPTKIPKPELRQNPNPAPTLEQPTVPQTTKPVRPQNLQTRPQRPDTPLSALQPVDRNPEPARNHELPSEPLTPERDTEPDIEPVVPEPRIEPNGESLAPSIPETVEPPIRDIRPDVPARPERIDRPERPERPQRPDRPERPQRPDRPG